MKDKIEQILNVLIGLSLRNAGRSADLEWFEFGSTHSELPIDSDGAAPVGEYVLDTECAWHIAGPNGIVVASRDRLYPAGDDPYKDLIGFEWDKPGVNRCDERIKQLFQERKDLPLIVETIEANNIGGLRVNLSTGYVLEIFPDDSLDSEYWRFFEPSKNNKHFVVTAHGIET